MTVYCIEDFKLAYQKLIRKNSYHSLTVDIINYFFCNDVQQLCTGVNLNNSNTIPFIKKRLSGSGGYRLYYLVLIKDSNIYLSYVHPKTGSMGFDSITDDSKSLLFKKTLIAIQTNTLYLLTPSRCNTKLTFS